MAKQEFTHYDFETDDVFPEYTLVLFFRNIKNEYLIKAFKIALEQLKSNKNAEKCIQSVDKLNIEHKYFNNVHTYANKDFKTVKSQLERKHDLMFTSWKIKNAVFFRNNKDSNEWILSVAYKGTYED